MQVAWIGLGAMGRPMAAHLAAEFPTRVWNRTAAVADAHAAQHGSTAVAELTEVADADVVFTCLPTTAEVADVAERLRPHLRSGQVWVDCTSGDPDASRELAAVLAEAGVSYVDAPVSGGTDGAAQGRLTVMLGGDADAVGRIWPVVGAFAVRSVHVGPVGAGHAVKAVNNTLLAANLWAAGEGLAALVRYGVAAETALEVINASSGRSHASQTLIPERVVTREFPVTFTLGLHVKDVGIGQSVLEGAEVPAPVLRVVGEMLRAATAELGGEHDHTAALQITERRSGVEIR